MNWKLAVIALVAISMSLSFEATAFTVNAVGQGGKVASAAPLANQTIHANLGAVPSPLTCPVANWHFVITQIDDPSLAPASITVTWSTGETTVVPLDNVTPGGVAHYNATPPSPSSFPVDATASIYDAWSGEFNLSDFTCVAVTPTSTPEATNTPGPTSTPEATNTPGPTSTPEATNTPGPTSTPEATNTPGPTNTPSPTATTAPGLTPTATSTPSGLAPVAPTSTSTPVPPGPAATATPEVGVLGGEVTPSPSPTPLVPGPTPPAPIPPTPAPTPPTGQVLPGEVLPGAGGMPLPTSAAAFLGLVLVSIGFAVRRRMR